MPATLGTARELADAGRLAEARSTCGRSIREAGNDRREPRFWAPFSSPGTATDRRRLPPYIYLDPDHPEAIRT
ncbi:MAG: hypothetical protein U0792_03370 [Gemmataceae bacterium]